MEDTTHILVDLFSPHYVIGLFWMYYIQQLHLQEQFVPFFVPSANQHASGDPSSILCQRPPSPSCGTMLVLERGHSGGVVEPCWCWRYGIQGGLHLHHMVYISNAQYKAVSTHNAGALAVHMKVV
jgi:hypothetical protein